MNNFELEAKLNVKSQLGPLKPGHKKTRSVASARTRKPDATNSEKLFAKLDEATKDNRANFSTTDLGNKRQKQSAATLEPLSPRGPSKFKKPLNSLLKSNITINGNLVLPSIKTSNTAPKK